MPRKPANKSVAGIATEFEKIERRKLTIEIDTRVHQELTHMIEYISETRGIKPSIDEVIEKVLVRAIQGDAGFAGWKDKANAKSRASTPKPGEVTAKEVDA